MNNYAFIDGQNLYQGLDWNLNYKKFRIALKDKYKVTKAYYFIGFKQKENGLYEKLQDAGFILVFNLKGEKLKSNKKGNIDTNLVFNVMKKLIHDNFGNVVLVSGDGDYKMMVDYLVDEKRFEKVIAPNLKYASSLYKDNRNLTSNYFANLGDMKSKLEYFKK